MNCYPSRIHVILKSAWKSMSQYDRAESEYCVCLKRLTRL